MSFQVVEIDGKPSVKLVDPTGVNTAQVTASGALKVDTGAAIVLAGLLDTMLLNGASEAMNVNGSVTPVVFKFEPDAVNDVELQTMAMIAETGTVDFGTKFMSITGGLSNGVLIEVKAGDITYELGTLKSTKDMALFSNNGFNLYIAGQDMVLSQRSFPSGLTLKKSGTYATADFIKVTIRDNLTGLTSFVARVKGVKT